MKRVAIIGAGVSGLACALRLEELKKQNGADLEIRIYESAPRAGGVVETGLRDGFLLEKGPDVFLSREPWVPDLCRKLGIDAEILNTRSENRKVFAVKNGKFVTLAEGFDPAVSVRMFSFLSAPLFSEPRYDLLLSFQRGMETLTRAMVSRLPKESLRLNSRAGLRQESPSGRWMVSEENGAGGFFDAVCVSVSAKEAARLLRDTDSVLSEKLLGILFESVATLNLAYKREQISGALDGFGFVVPAVEKKSFTACTFSSQKFAGRAPEDCALLRAFAGGAFGKEFFGMSDDALIKTVLRDLEGLLGISGEPLFSSIARYPDSLPQYCADHEAKVTGIERDIRRHTGLFLTGASYRGIGIAHCVRDAQLQAEKMYRQLF